MLEIFFFLYRLHLIGLFVTGEITWKIHSVHKSVNIEGTFPSGTLVVAILRIRVSEIRLKKISWPTFVMTEKSIEKIRTISVRGRNIFTEIL